MDGCMNRWYINGWMDEWMDAYMDERMGRQNEGLTIRMDEDG